MRLRFLAGDGADMGVAIWQLKRNLDIPVAHSPHIMDTIEEPRADDREWFRDDIMGCEAR